MALLTDADFGSGEVGRQISGRRGSFEPEVMEFRGSYECRDRRLEELFRILNLRGKNASCLRRQRTFLQLGGPRRLGAASRGELERGVASVCAQRPMVASHGSRTGKSSRMTGAPICDAKSHFCMLILLRLSFCLKRTVQRNGRENRCCPGAGPRLRCRRPRPLPKYASTTRTALGPQQTANPATLDNVLGLILLARTRRIAQ